MTRINTNIQSLIAQRVLGQNNNALSTSMTRLSTGLRINNGRDDPAGLIASESLRASKVAINAAIDNARRADNVVSVAEAGLNEVNSLLLDLEDLIDRSANEAALSDDEREANQLQIDSILQSINRIANTTAFGDLKLLDGSLGFTTSGVTAGDIVGVQVNAAKIPNGATRDVVVQVQASAEYAQVRLSGTGAGGALDGAATIEVRGQYGADTLSFASGTTVSDLATAINTSTALTGVSATVDGTGVIVASTTYGSDAMVAVDQIAGTMNQDADIDYGVDPTIVINGANAYTKGLNASVRSGSMSLDLVLDSSFATQTSSDSTFAITGGGAVFAISPEVGLVGQETLGIPSTTAASLGNADVGYLSSLGTGETNDVSSGNFAQAQRIVREAQDQISQLRGRIGGFQKDTLQTTINSLLVAEENTTAAESAIRDADFAVEVAALTRAQILVQSNISTLQLANQLPANALALLG
jgi:flagellin